ncbi:hypothetical protein HC251_25280 (plasmid) [Iamia sp. SCSIO 61187]|uniref:D-alanyl-D-alanine carboxypeptidase family protein n=1 Tax=Iamia sp. SCSIO 61187 TaxID=2722752 RepID=UPI001C62D7BC|nr:D-alanyl-D-alanine carboxypeptidase family protein [Iamia sp. SCSIO 61187]QYG95864.1 hypothetical protein HC251_25280 [Iamia sp. SCSIO 61187]
MTRTPQLIAGGLLAVLGPLTFIVVGEAATEDAQRAAVPGLAAGGLDPVVAQAYTDAAALARTWDPPCEVPPWIIAGIGEVESGHGTHGGATVGADGTISPPIIGIALNGAGATAAIADTDDGALDGDTTWDRAVGPMQFIPSTWAAHAIDGNGDGTAEPSNIFDAAATTAAYLCASAPPMATEADWRTGILAYNHSEAYVAAVLAAAYGYRDAPTAVPVAGQGPVPIAEVQGVPIHAALAPRVAAMITAAAADGVDLRIGNSYRTPEEQIALRRQHCGTSDYAIYEMPSGQCRPPTARPGQSMHQQGLAIDFADCSSRSSACYRWLDANAGAYGLFNLPSEPWHWSIDGS